MEDLDQAHQDLIDGTHQNLQKEGRQVTREEIAPADQGGIVIGDIPGVEMVGQGVKFVGSVIEHEIVKSAVGGENIYVAKTDPHQIQQKKEAEKKD